MAPNEFWIERNESTDELRREAERERLVLWAIDEIAGLMEESGVSKADMARKLEKSRAYITQVFSGSRNPTLATISDLAWACGQRAVVKFEPLKPVAFTSQPPVSLPVPSVRLVWQREEPVEEPRRRYAGGM